MPGRYPTKAEYAEYLRSPSWTQLRRLAVEVFGSRCMICGSTDGINVHHKTYARWPDESIRDLCILCRACHELAHDKLARPPDAPPPDTRVLGDQAASEGPPPAPGTQSRLFPGGRP